MPFLVRLCVTDGKTQGVADLPKVTPRVGLRELC